MRISDWSSDVCSSDLIVGLAVAVLERRQIVEQIAEVDVGAEVGTVEPEDLDDIFDAAITTLFLALDVIDGFDVEILKRGQRRREFAVADRRIADRIGYQRGTNMNSSN